MKYTQISEEQYKAVGSPKAGKFDCREDYEYAHRGNIHYLRPKMKFWGMDMFYFDLGEVYKHLVAKKWKPISWGVNVSPQYGPCHMPTAYKKSM